MKIADIIKRINKLVGNGNYAYKDLVEYMDECVDLINVEIEAALPLFSTVYTNAHVKTPDELLLEYSVNSAENQYTRIPDEYIRNYICYEVAYRKLRDEDEAEEVYNPKMAHAYTWFEKLRSRYSHFTTENVEAITVNGDVRSTEPVDSVDPHATPGLF
jgi:hypothetical protein